MSVLFLTLSPGVGALNHLLNESVIDIFIVCLSRLKHQLHEDRDFFCFLLQSVS